MASQQDVFTLLADRMRAAPTPYPDLGPAFERPSIPELIQNIDRALRVRRAA